MEENYEPRIIEKDGKKIISGRRLTCEEIEIQTRLNAMQKKIDARLTELAKLSDDFRSFREDVENKVRERCDKFILEQHTGSD